MNRRTRLHTNANRKLGVSCFLPRLRFGLVVVVVVGALAGWCGPAAAESGGVHRLMGAGLDVELDTRWVDAPGYRPVRITVTPRPASLAERTISVEFLVHRRGWGDGHDLRVEKELVIPAGSKPVETILSVPQHWIWKRCEFNVSENGRVPRGLRLPSTYLNNSPDRFCEAMPWVLFIGDDEPDTQHLAHVVPRDEYNHTPYSNVTSSLASNQLPTGAWRREKELSENWIDYTCFDVVCLSLEELEGLEAERREALLRWTHAGGNLWVYGIGKQWERIEQLDRLVGLPSIPLGEPPDLIDVNALVTTASLDSEPAAPAEAKRSEQGWEFPERKFFDWSQRGGSTTYSHGPVQVRERFDQQGLGTVTIEGRLGRVSDAIPERLKRLKNPHFLLRHHGLGQIVALAADNPFAGSHDQQRNQWGWVLGAVGMERLLSYQRNGVSMDRDNGEVWNFLIPGVGLAPVTEFCVLITFFVLAIGPLNFYLLKRWKRHHLLVVTIPAGALTITLLLFGYALVSDGLGTRVRARSVTRIDQRQGEAATRARLSYYAGLAPGRGLTFEQDTTVTPLDEEPPHEYYPSRPLGRDMVWGDNQWLASGWLSSRTPTQYLTTRARSTGKGIDLIDDGDGNVKIKNRLGTAIKQLGICSEDGRWYWAEGVAAGETVPVEPLGFAMIRTRMNSANIDNEPTVPDGMVGSGGGIFGGSRRGRYWYGGMNSSLGRPTQSTGRLERPIASIGLIGNSGHDEMPAYEPRSYVAVVEGLEEGALGVTDANEENSYHVVLGKW